MTVQQHVTSRRSTLKYFGRIVKAQNLAATIHHGCVGGVRGRGRPRRRWMDAIKDWTGLSAAECVKIARERQQWRELVTLVWSSSMVSYLQQWSWSVVEEEEEKKKKKKKKKKKNKKHDRKTLSGILLSNYISRHCNTFVVDLRGVGRMISRNGQVIQLQIVSGLHKTDELGMGWWGCLWSPTFSNIVVPYA